MGSDTKSVRVTLGGNSVAGVGLYGDPAGIPVLALHGAPACRMMFEAFDCAARSQGLRLLAPDRPGYGLTPRDCSATLLSRTDWLERLCTALQLERFAILAISGGAPYAVSLAARLGPRVTALALVSPMGPVEDLIRTSPGAPFEVPFLQRRFFLHLPKRRIFPALAKAAGRLYMAAPKGFGALLPLLARDPDAAILRRPSVRDVMLRMTREALREGAHGSIDDLAIYGRSWEVDFDRVEAPCLLWQGMADRVVPVAASLFLASRLPRCRLIKLEGAGHFWAFARPEAVLNELHRMLLSDPESHSRRNG